MICCEDMKEIHRTILWCDSCKFKYYQKSFEDKACPRCGAEFVTSLTLEILIKSLTDNVMFTLFNENHKTLNKRVYDFLIEYGKELIKERNKFNRILEFCTKAGCNYTNLRNYIGLGMCPDCGRVLTEERFSTFITNVIDYFPKYLVNNRRSALPENLNIINDLILEIKEEDNIDK